MTQEFRIREFAARAGVTVKALHHYDRLGLLVPGRSQSGQRRYTALDLQRLRQIAALKSLGLSLNLIGKLLKRHGPAPGNFLCDHGRLMRATRRAADRAIRILDRAQQQREPAPSSDIVAILLASISMDDSIEAMRTYFGEAAWYEGRAYYERWPSAAWQSLYRDINLALDVEPHLDPADDRAQAFADRWRSLDAADTATPAVRLGLRRAWADRQQWPGDLGRRFDELRVERAARFASAAMWERWDAERMARERATNVRPRVSEARQMLYRDGAGLLASDPSSAAVQTLVARWMALIDQETGGDLGMKTEMIRCFRERTEWPAGMVRCVASSYGLDPSTWRSVADLIEAGHDRLNGVVKSV